MNPIKSTIKCCGCIVLSQLLCLLFSIGSCVVFILLFKFYVIQWGQDQIRKGLNLPMDADLSNLSTDTKAANSCTGCVLGSNTQWPTNSTGGLHFLDTTAGPTASAAMATTLAVAGAVGTGSMLWASFFPSATAATSFMSGFYEMTHLFEQAQFIGIIAQLQLRGAPEFLFQFSKELAWTNFNFPRPLQEKSPFARRLADLFKPEIQNEAGVPKYAAMIGVDPKNLYWYTLATFSVLIAAFHALFIVFMCLLTLCTKESFVELARKLYRKVIWAGVLVLLLCQYIIAMTGSFYIYNYGINASPQQKDSRYIYGLLSLLLMNGFALVFGVFIVGSNRKELEDVGTYEHDQRPFSAKYSPYYDEYNFDNRFFFIPRLLLSIVTGCIVGCVYHPMWQILAIMGITVLYLALLIIREPNLLRFLYYIGLSSAFMKIVLLCMMLILVKDDYFPQVIRDKVAYGIIGVNMFVFFLLFLRQAYLILHKLILSYKKQSNKSEREAALNHEPSSVYNQINSSRVENDRQPNNRPQGQFSNKNNNTIASAASIGASQQRNTQQNKQPPVDPYKGYEAGRRQNPLAPSRTKVTAAKANSQPIYEGYEAGRRQNSIGPSHATSNRDDQPVDQYKEYNTGRHPPPGDSRSVDVNSLPPADPYKVYDGGKKPPLVGIVAASRKQNNTSQINRERGVSFDIDGDDDEVDTSIGANKMKNSSKMYAPNESPYDTNTNSNGHASILDSELRQDSLLLDTSALDDIAIAYLKKAGESAIINGENVVGEHDEDDEDHDDEEKKNLKESNDSKKLLENNFNQVSENDLGIDEEIVERSTAGTVNDVHGDVSDDDEDYELDTNVHIEDDISDSDFFLGDRGSIPLLTKQFSRDSAFSDYS